MFLGLNFVFYRNGYRYHTKFDDYDSILAGTYQHIGDNLLYLISELANAPELSNPREQTNGKVIYFDFFEMFMIYYTEATAVVINIAVSMLSVIVALRNFHHFGLSMFF